MTRPKLCAYCGEEINKPRVIDCKGKPIDLALLSGCFAIDSPQGELSCCSYVCAELLRRSGKPKETK